MRGELTILGIFLLAIAQWYASDSPRSRQIAYGLFGLAAAIAVVMAVRGVGIGAGLRVERGLAAGDRAAEPLDHRGNDVVG